MVLASGAVEGIALTKVRSWAKRVTDIYRKKPRRVAGNGDTRKL